MTESDVERLSRIMLDEFSRLHRRFDDLDHGLAALNTEVSGVASEVVAIHRRLDTLEQAMGNVTGFAKEIDHLLNRIVEIEKHLGLNTLIKA